MQRGDAPAVGVDFSIEPQELRLQLIRPRLEGSRHTSSAQSSSSAVIVVRNPNSSQSIGFVKRCVDAHAWPAVTHEGLFNSCYAASGTWIFRWLRFSVLVAPKYPKVWIMPLVL